MLSFEQLLKYSIKSGKTDFPLFVPLALMNAVKQERLKQLITKKSEIKTLLETCFIGFNKKGLDNLVDSIHKHILSNRVKFPILEFAGESIFETLPEDQHIPFCDKIQYLKTEGGNVLLGIILQKRLQKHFAQSIKKAEAYIADADIWYVCDIIGERVFGYALLHQTKKTIPEIEKLMESSNNWVVRSLGAGIHYAIKKGLDNDSVEILFNLLLSKAASKEKEIRQGIGWAAKTTARFHPEIIKSYKNNIENTENVANWFRKKIDIGLNRNSYAKRN